jgi:hypothetical protein
MDFIYCPLSLINMTYDPKRTECERKLEQCEHMRQRYLEAYHNLYLYEMPKMRRELSVAKNRVKKLKAAQRAAQLPFMGFI